MGSAVRRTIFDGTKKAKKTKNKRKRQRADTNGRSNGAQSDVRTHFSLLKSVKTVGNEPSAATATTTTSTATKEKKI